MTIPTSTLSSSITGSRPICARAMVSMARSRSQSGWATTGAARGALTDRRRYEIGVDGEGADDEITIGDHAAHLAVLDDRENTDVGLLYDLGGFGERCQTDRSR